MAFKNSTARQERAALVTTMRGVGPEQPTLCGDWTTRDLAAHLVVRERRLDAAPGILLPALADYTARVQEQVHVGVNQAGQQRSVAEIDDLRTRRMRHRWSDGADAAETTGTISAAGVSAIRDAERTRGAGRTLGIDGGGTGRTCVTGRTTRVPCSSAVLRRSRSISCKNLSISPVGLRPGPSAAGRCRTGSSLARLLRMVLTSQTISTTTGTTHSPFMDHPVTGRSLAFRSLPRTPAIEFRISVSDWRFFML